MIAFLLGLSIALAQDFRFSTFSEVQNLDPRKIDRYSGQHVISSLFRGYFSFDDESGLLPELAENCKWINSKTLACNMRKNIYSDGTPIPLNDYKNAFIQLFTNKEYVRAAKDFLSIINAEDILAGKKEPSELGIQIKPPNQVIFKLISADSDLIYKLITPAISPLGPNANLYTGPFRLLEKKANRITLENNPYYHSKLNRPKVIIEVVESNVAALNLYKSGRLHLVLQVPTEKFDDYKNKSEFQFHQLQRFDYIGLSGKLNNNPSVRKSIVSAIQFVDFKKVFKSPGDLGCFGIKLSNMKVPCLTFEKHNHLESEKLNLYFALQFDSNIKRTMEWLQAQWKKNLNIAVELKEEEFQLLTQRLISNPPDLFRRGVPLERPTCLNAVEIFESRSHENYIKMNDSTYDRIVEELRSPQLTVQERHKKCEIALSRLLKSNLIIPLGPIHFGTLRSPLFKGVKLNSLNQLNLAELQPQNNAPQ